MRRFLALSIVVSWVCIASTAHAVPPFENPEIQVVDKGEHVALTVRLIPVDGADYPTGAVPFTAEPYSIMVSPASGTLEYDLFGSGFAMDLDGDGQTSDTVAIGCFAGGVIQLAGTPVRPFVEDAEASVWRGNYRNPDGTARVARIGPKGAWFAQYTPCAPDRSTTVGLASAESKSMRVHEVPGPVLQLLVFEELFIPSNTPTAQISKLTRDGKRVRDAFAATTHAYEPVFDAKPFWHGVVWRMIPLGKSMAPHTITARLTATGQSRRRMVVAIVNTSPAPGIRERASFASAPLSL